MSAQFDRISDEIIESILKEHDIVDTVGKYVHLTKQGKYMKGLCPFHSEKTPSFTVTPDKQIFHCYGCGKGGGIIKFIMEIEGCSFAEAVELLAIEVNIPITWKTSDGSQSPKQADRERLFEAHELASKLYHYILRHTQQGTTAMAYLRSRGFSEQTIDLFRIGYAPDRWDTLVQLLQKRGFNLDLMQQGGLISKRTDERKWFDRFRNRIIFPICDASGKPIAFAGRVLGDEQPKYLNSSETLIFKKSRTLYNLHQAKSEIRRTGKIVLFEGYVDVIQAWTSGVMNGVATMGTALTEEHILLMKRFSNQVILCFDADAAGEAATLKTLSLLQNAGVYVQIAMLPESIDPDEYIKANGPDKFQNEIIGLAVSTTKFKLLNLRKSYVLLEEQGVIRYVQAALKVIAQLTSPTEREVYLQELGNEFNISIQTLKQECNLIIQYLQKNKEHGDNKNSWWNNIRNNHTRDNHPQLLPAYVNAERKLLAMMLQSAEVTDFVHKQLNEDFNVSDHAALAAYLYSFYAQGREPDISQFLTFLHDDRLERLVSLLAVEEICFDDCDQVLRDCIREIKKVPMHQEIEQKKEAMNRAERTGNVMLAAQIASDIIALERDLKGSSDLQFLGRKESEDVE